MKEAELISALELLFDMNARKINGDPLRSMQICFNSSTWIHEYIDECEYN